jgi:thioredoxin reductase
MNCQVDIVIIGDSLEGRKVVKKLAADRPAIKIAFVSRDFKSITTHDYLNVEYIKDEVIFTDYKNRLFGCYLKSGKRIYCTHLIIATGLAYEPVIISNKQVPCVFNNTDDISKQAKNSQAVVLGKQDSDVKFATAIAKKYKYVYFCIESFAADIADKNIQKLINIENLVVLPNASLTKFTVTDNLLSSVELSNYSTLTCSAIYAKTASKPETAFVSDKLISKDEKGYLSVSNLAQSQLVPKCFAIGTCVNRCTQKMTEAMINTVLNDFTGGN